MPDSAPKEKSAKRRSRGGEDPNYDSWFTGTPEPWAQIAVLAHGGDRTYATTVERMVLNAEPAQRSTLEGHLLTVLSDPKCTEAGRLFVVRMLGLIGSATSVAVLAKLLGETKTADQARYALDRIPEASVDEVYRGALTKLTGAPKIGLIGSIALRGDKSALGSLSAIQQNAAEPAGVRAAAARAVARLNSL